MAEEHTHHHNYAKANAEYFTEQAQSYRAELSIEIAKRCATFIVNKYSFDANQTEVLDFACGPGLIAFELLPNAKRILGADSAAGMVDVFNRTVDEQGLSRDKIHCVKVDSLKGDDTDLDGALFDVIICVQAYHHFEDPLQITRAFAKRLKPNGRLMVIDFANAGNIENFFELIHGQGHDHGHGHGHRHGHGHNHENDHDHGNIHDHIVAHVNGFTAEQMIDMFTAAGLKNPQVEAIFVMPKDELKKYQAHERLTKVIQSDLEFAFHYFLASGDKN